MSMSAIPRSARLSSPTEVVAILVASAIVWIGLIAALFAVLFFVLLPNLEFSGKSEIPKDIPVYPGAQLNSAFATKYGGCTTVEATWTTGDDSHRVVSFYSEQLSAGGWTVTDTRNRTGGTEIDFSSTSGPLRQGFVFVESPPYSNQTEINLTLYKSPGVPAPPGCAP